MRLFGGPGDEATGGRQSEGSSLDMIARGLAGGMSRREALRVGGAALVGAVAISPADAWAAATGRCPHHRVRCHGTCCPAGEVCLPPRRKGGKRRCGCPDHKRRCSGRCVNVHDDVRNCGTCGHACASGQVCANGVCACPSGQAMCSGVCVTLAGDPKNCGACGHACATGEVCAAGQCATQCPAGQANCGGICIDTATDPANCGACGTACPTGEACVGGVCGCPAGQTNCGGACVDLSSNVQHCGMCNTACSTYFAVSSCQAGTCHIDSCSPGWLDCDGNPLTGCECLSTSCLGTMCGP